MPFHLVSTPTDYDVRISRPVLHNANQLQDLNNQVAVRCIVVAMGVTQFDIAEMLYSRVKGQLFDLRRNFMSAMH